jgi:hypothetical protein
MMRYTAHVKVFSGDSFKFVGFGTNGRFIAKIYDSSDGSLYCEGAAKALLAGHEYDLQFIGVPNVAGLFLLNFSHGDSGVCEVSDITVTNLGAFLLCAPQNYIGSSFLQGNGEAISLNGGEAFYDLYKPRIVSTKGYPQFNGQLCITPADGKVYIAVRTAKRLYMETNQQYIIMTRLHRKYKQLKEELQSTDYIALKAFEGRDVSDTRRLAAAQAGHTRQHQRPASNER